VEYATKLFCVKTSCGKVVVQSISYEITKKYRTESVSFHLKYWLRLTYPAVASSVILVVVFQFLFQLKFLITRFFSYY